MTTARYLEQQLKAAGVSGVDEIDSSRAGSDKRGLIIRRFAPYYNGSSPAELTASGHEEIRVLISTDVLSEGLNLQDATRLINYDLHWNPVRLMQRIGRVDRRMNPQVEARIAAEHPDRAALLIITGGVRGFTPPYSLSVLACQPQLTYTVQYVETRSIPVAHMTVKVHCRRSCNGSPKRAKDIKFDDLPDCHCDAANGCVPVERHRMGRVPGVSSETQFV